MQYMGEENRAGTARLEWGSYSYTTIPRLQIPNLLTPQPILRHSAPDFSFEALLSQVDEVAR